MDLKIEHGGDAVSQKCYVITGSDNGQSVCWEGDADYEAIKTLQSDKAELVEALRSLYFETEIDDDDIDALLAKHSAPGSGT